MNLGEVRAKFIALSGYEHLVKAKNVDNGANFLINAGQRYLDSLQDSPKSSAWLKKDIAAGDITLTFQNTRAIEEVWLANADGRVMLAKKSLKWLREIYDKAAADETRGQPRYFAPLVMGLAPEQADLTEDNYDDDYTYDTDGIMFGSHFAYSGILFMPPADGIYTISVKAKWFSKELSEDTDETFWTVRYPEVLIQATYMALEEFHRNTEGVRDWMRVIASRVSGIDRNLADEESAGITQIEG